MASSSLCDTKGFFINVLIPREEGVGVLGLIIAGYVPLAPQSPYPIIVYSVAYCRLHCSHFWANVIFAISTYSLSIYVSTIYQSFK